MKTTNCDASYTQAFMVSYASEDQEKYAEKVVASLRHQFDGHDVCVREE